MIGQLNALEPKSKLEASSISEERQGLPDDSEGVENSFPLLLNAFQSEDALPAKTLSFDQVGSGIPLPSSHASTLSADTEISDISAQTLKDILPQLSLKGKDLIVKPSTPSDLSLNLKVENTDESMVAPAEESNVIQLDIVDISNKHLDASQAIAPGTVVNHATQPSSTTSSQSNQNNQNGQSFVGNQQGGQAGGQQASSQQSGQQPGQQGQADAPIISQSTTRIQASQEQSIAAQFKSVLAESEKVEREASSLNLGVDGKTKLPLGMQSINHHLRSPQWGKALGQRVLYMANQKIQEAKITLNPEKLGPIQIKITVDKDQNMHVSMTAQHVSTREALEASVPKLKEILESASADLVNVDINRDKDFEQQAKNEQESHSKNNSHLVDKHEEKKILETKVIHSSDNMVDFYA